MRKLIAAIAFASLSIPSRPLSTQEASPKSLPSSSTTTRPAEAAGPVHENVVYGTVGGETLHLDIFEPAKNDHPRAAVVLIHGGGWTSFDKSTMRNMAQFLARSGFVAVPVDYRLFHNDATRWPAQLDDVQRAVRWVRANAAKYNIAPDRVGAYGHSAGAQLAALLGMIETRDNSDATLAKFSSKVAAVAEASGPSEFAPYPKDSEEQKFFNSLFGDYAKHADVWGDASPVNHAAKSNAPFLIIHGTKDEMVPFSQGQLLFDKLTKAGATVQFVQMETDHMFSDPIARRRLAVETRGFFERELMEK